MMRSSRCILAVVLAATTTVACGRKKPPEQPPQPPPPQEAPATKPATPPPPPSPPPAPPTTPTEDEIYGNMPLDEIAKKYLGDVFFDFDSVVIKDDARAQLQKNAEFLKRRGTAKITIEGHADSRGTNEYNLALGERRAGAARDYLVSLGVTTDRIAIVSKGEEQPFCREENESCWSQNRRGHFLVTQR